MANEKVVIGLMFRHMCPIYELFSFNYHPQVFIQAFITTE